MKRNEYVTKPAKIVKARIVKARYHHEMYVANGMLFAISTPSADTRWFNFKGYEVSCEFGAGINPPTILGDE